MATVVSVLVARPSMAVAGEATLSGEVVGATTELDLSGVRVAFFDAPRLVLEVEREAGGASRLGLVPSGF